jgi:two-component system sensor kinase FixL
VLQLAHTELLTRRIDIVTQIQPNLPRFPGDKVQLQQVFLNLILNACEAMSAATFPDRRVILTADADGNGDVHIAIRDFGTGIPAHLLGRLFEPFVTTKPDGLGLGLSISRTIVTAHGGRLWAENKTDGGAHVHCVFPLSESSPGIPRATAHSLVTVQER